MPNCHQTYNHNVDALLMCFLEQIINRTNMISQTAFF